MQKVQQCPFIHDHLDPLCPVSDIFCKPLPALSSLHSVAVVFVVSTAPCWAGDSCDRCYSVCSLKDVTTLWRGKNGCVHVQNQNNNKKKSSCSHLTLKWTLAIISFFSVSDKIQMLLDFLTSVKAPSEEWWGRASGLIDIPMFLFITCLQVTSVCQDER